MTPFRTWTREEHDPALPPEDVDAFGRRRAPRLPEQPMHVLATGPEVEDVPCDHGDTVANRRLCDPKLFTTCTDCGRTVDPDAPTVADLADVPIWRYDDLDECEHGATLTSRLNLVGPDGSVLATTTRLVTVCLACHHLAPTQEDQP